MRVFHRQSTITARFRPPILAAIEAIADREHVSKAEVMRRAVEHFVLNQDETAPMALPILLREEADASPGLPTASSYQSFSPRPEQQKGAEPVAPCYQTQAQQAPELGQKKEGVTPTAPSLHSNSRL